MEPTCLTNSEPPLQLSEEEAWRLAVYQRTVLQNPFIPHKPTPKQAEFLLKAELEALYGGAAGGGKSDALLMGALQWVAVPSYSALVLRRTYSDLAKSGALMDRAKEWLYHTAARPKDGGKRWVFPSGSTLEFGYLDAETDKYQYQSAEYQYIAFDELTQFSEGQYTYLFSRLRKAEGCEIPLRMRAGSNPGGIGHEWVKRRFITPAWLIVDRVFVPARLADNPYLDQKAYLASLQELDPITRAQLLAGDWDAYEGGRFHREWFRRFSEDGQRFYLHDPSGKQARLKAASWTFCTLDPAATEKETSDYTAIEVFTVTDQRELLIRDVIREHLPIDAIIPRLWQVCQAWHPFYVGIEGAGAFMALVKEARKTHGIPTVKLLDTMNKSKLVRATPAINRSHAGQVYIPEQARWLDEFLAELVQFTGGERHDAHDDQVDALAYGVICLDQTGTGQWWSDAEETQEDTTPKTWRELYDFHQQGGGRPGMSNQERKGLYGLGQRRW
jgi:predicted phage terminase large subunit-like protein